MQPLSEIPRGALRDLRGLAFDIDDTVTRHGKLEPEAFSAMWRLHDAGLRLVAVTGRPLGWAAVVARHWPVDIAIGENGAGWFLGASSPAPGVPRVGYFEDEAARAAGALLLARIEQHVHEHFPHVLMADDQGGRRCDLAFDVGERVQLPAADVAALVRAIESFGARAVVSSVHAHVVPGPWDKAQGIVRAVRALLGEDVLADLGRWAFVGDSGNDVQAFAFFPLSVGVANLREQLPLVHEPSYITRAERGRGFAELADAILASRSSAAAAD